ncbi:MAG: glycoside hydrolase family 3 C-terminal domain-containing protein [Candidatus Omnitrophota bacterium]|nr:glycoside hydrolase family 3 C-terminal domain-containing protein [Candidatus Omnitrophota bacterium]
MDFKRVIAACVIIILLPFSVCRADPATEKSINDLISQMTLEEKVKLLAGKEMDTFPIDRLGIPALKMTDGPVGMRFGHATAFPSSVSMAASWDTDLLKKIGWALAREAKGKGRDMLLGPCINIHRVPMGGRNFESFGEDPYLAGRMSVAYIKGVQDEKVIATVKHYAVNNQEWERGSINVIVDERTLREIYLPAFEASIKEGGAWSIMAAYNKVNGFHCTENNHLVNEILKNEWGFKGFMVSDWGATHSTVNCANYGLDVEMPGIEFFNQKLVAAVKNGEVKESVIDDKVRRVLRAMFFADLFDKNSAPDSGEVNTPAIKEVALQGAREGIVLLKNEKNILPIDITKIKSIAVIGPNAAVARTGGGGSSDVSPFYSISPLDGLKDRLGNKIEINYSLGCKFDDEISPIPSSALFTTYNGEKVNGLLGEYFNSIDLKGEPVLKRVDKQISFDWQERAPGSGLGTDNFSVRWTGKLVPSVTREMDLIAMSDDGMRIWLDGKLLLDDWKDHAAEMKKIPLKVEAGKQYDLRVEYYERGGGAVARLGWDSPKELIDEAVAIAKKSDLAIIFGGFNNKIESEGFDRANMDLPDNQNALIEKVAAANKNTIIVLNTGAPVAMSKWIDKIPAVVEAWYPGQECGNAIADVLLGNYNPGGKLPTTFPVKWEDCPAYGNFPGGNGQVTYAEGIFVGYRYFDTKNVKVLFPFGHGLSYTTFAYSNIKITPNTLPGDGFVVDVSADIKNTGTREGAEVAQLYVSDKEASVARPLKELKGFQRVVLKPGETKTVNFRLDKRAMAFYDVNKKDWVAEPGEFEVLIGSSSQDIRLKGNFILEKGKMM